MDNSKFMQHSKTDRWVRSKNGILSGVCQGLGESFNVDPNLIRLIWIAMIFFFGTGIFLYILLALVLPAREDLCSYYQPKGLGVCYELSKRTGAELGLLRLLTVVLAFMSLGAVLIIYFAAYLLMPSTQPWRL